MDRFVPMMFLPNPKNPHKD